MLLKTIRVSNFRCLKDIALNVDKLTVLIGPNGSGKSSLVRAIEIFYSPNANYDDTDFYDSTREISIILTFSDLSPEERELFKHYVQGDDLTVEKLMSPPPNIGTQKYYGRRLKNPEFDGFRQATGSGLRQEYEKMREKYPSLPTYSNRETAEQSLKQWELSNSAECQSARDDGQFFGFKPVGEAHLEKFTRLIAIPAVRDAALDVAEARGTPISQIKDLLIERELSGKQEYTDLQNETKESVARILPDLRDLSGRLTKFLQTYVPDSQVELKWERSDSFDLPIPTVNTAIMEDEHYSPVPKTGHGLQRAFIMAMLQYLATTQTTAAQTESNATTGATTIPNLMIAIEEPELYQHPDRQRHIAKTLLSLSTGGTSGVVQRIQVVYSTHSPLFVDLERFEQIRICGKVFGESGKAKHTRFSNTTFDTIAGALQQVRSHGTYTESSIKPHLRVLMTPWFNEGFFADLVVLVEGITDRACILALALAMGHDLESRGIAVIPYNSKNSLDYAALIFKNLEIPIYAIWDGDSPKNESIQGNRLLLRLFNAPEEDFPALVTEAFAVFKKDMFDTLEDEVGKTLYEEILTHYRQQFEIEDEKKVLENPSIMHDIYQEIKKRGQSSPTLEKIVSQITARIK